MHTSSLPVPTGATGTQCGTRRRGDCPAYALPRVRELPLRLEPVTADSFGGLVTGRAAYCAVPTTHRRGALS